MIIKDGPNIKRIFRNRIAQSPNTASNTPIILNDTSQVIADSNARSSHKVNSPQPNTGDATPEYVIDRIIEYNIANDQSLLYRVQWYGYGPEDDTWEPTAHFPRSHNVRFHHLHNFSQSPAALLSQIQVG